MNAGMVQKVTVEINKMTPIWFAESDYNNNKASVPVLCPPVEGPTVPNKIPHPKLKTLPKTKVPNPKP